MKQTLKPSSDEKMSVKDARKVLKAAVLKVHRLSDRVAEWMDANENTFNTLVDNRQYEKAANLVERAAREIYDGLDLDDVASDLLDAQDESMPVEPRVPCKTCGK